MYNYSKTNYLENEEHESENNGRRANNYCKIIKEQSGKLQSKSSVLDSDIPAARLTIYVLRIFCCMHLGRCFKIRPYLKFLE